MGRKWSSPGGNVYAALRLPEPEDPCAGQLLSLIVGYCLLQALRRKGILVQLKWPNDLLLDGRKIAGLLIEHQQGAAMAGLGLNLQAAPELGQARGSSPIPAGDLRTAWPGAEPVQAWAELLYFGHLWYAQLMSSFSAPELVSEVIPHLWRLQRKVTVDLGSRSISGYLQGLGTDGAIILDCKGRQEHIRSGSLLG
jgi:BirA family biotin operon repressor/biotin-[acetyl-CoA-carboxylase] ligase